VSSPASKTNSTLAFGAISSGSTMFCLAVSVGSRLNDWNTKPIRRRRRRVRAVSPSAVSSVGAPPEKIRTLPLVTVSSPAAQCMSVDLPDPDGPMMAVNPPVSNAMLTPSRARTAVSPSP
jgi:hypothetical protein